MALVGIMLRIRKITYPPPYLTQALIHPIPAGYPGFSRIFIGKTVDQIRFCHTPDQAYNKG